MQRKRKNPSNQIKQIDDLIDKTETILINYDNLFKNLYKLNKWNICKDVILYYTKFLEMMIFESEYVRTGIKMKSKDILFQKGQDLKWWNTFENKSIFPLIDWILWKLHFIKEENERNAPLNIPRFQYLKEFHERLSEFYEILKINYLEFSKDIRICLKK